MATRCGPPPGQVGELLVDASGKVFAGNDTPVRGLFAPHDAWIATDDLFRVDADGDFWFEGAVSDSAEHQVCARGADIA